MPNRNIGLYRKTTQDLIPVIQQPVSAGQYDIYPGYSIGKGKIALGYGTLAELLADQRQVIIEGYIGVMWDSFRENLEASLSANGVQTNWQSIEQALFPEAEIDALIEPYLGGNDPIFGRRFHGSLSDFYDERKLAAIRPEPVADLNIVYGCGAALAGWDGLLVYIDVPKNEIQFRSRAGSIRNLGASQPSDPKPMYKRFYFVDWVVFNRHKADLLPDIDTFVDGQRPDHPLMISGEELRSALSGMSQSALRVRPWFEPGPWGGQWIRAKIPQLPQDVPNYAWSFELIVPENGLLLESDGRMLEISFDMLMYQKHQAILGDFSQYFGYEFPIRFDFLDTFDGGNLSVQCHPRPEFIREQFGENFTQDETYYILDYRPGACVYLGFQDDIKPEDFRSELERSHAEKTVIDINRFVNSEPAHKHDLFLIPNGTIHCSGVDNLVLEISATPYIFTFKMYDWMRLDLEGNPRPLNIERAFQNLYFDRKGKRVTKELIARPQTLSQGENWRLLHLPTHPDHFYDVHRLEFASHIHVEMHGSPHILSLVEGESILVETSNGRRQRFNYAETILIPAAASAYTLVNDAGGEAKVVKAFIKPEWFTRKENQWLSAPPDMLPRIR